MFLIRLAFWLTLVLLVLPMPERGDAHAVDAVSPADPSPQLSVIDAMVVAQSAISDAAGFCGRNPETCETGLELAGTLREKAQYGAQLVYEYLADEPVAGSTPPVTDVATPSVPGSSAQPVAAEGGAAAVPMPPVSDTLSEKDRQISWRGSING